MTARIGARLALAGVCVLGAGAAALGQAAPATPGGASVTSPPVQHWPAERILPPEPGTRGCWQRVYDARHLAAHPRQRITKMTFLLRVTGYDKNGDVVTRNADRVAYEFAIALQRRGDKRPLRTAGSCQGNPGDPVRCVVDCDGGGVTIDRTDDGKGLEVRLEGEGIAFGNDCDTERGRFVGPGSDDALVRLAAAPGAVCNQLEKSELGD